MCLSVASAACFEPTPRIPDDANATSDEGNLVPEDGSREADDAEARLSEAACDKRAACPEYGHVDAETCKAAPRCGSGPMLHIREDALVACLTAIEKASCDTFLSTVALPECEGVYGARLSPSGKLVELGAACTRDGMCPRDAYCDLSEVSCGACVQSKSPGDACDDDAECLSRRCQAGECTALRADGEACDRVAECAGGACNNRVCARSVLVPAKVGDACDGKGSCLRCESGVCLGILACVDGVCADPPVIGEHCSDECAADATCQSGTCVALPGPGEACIDLCAGYSTCVQGECTQSFCGADLKPGDRCSPLTWCGQGLTCDVTQQRCIALPRAGEACFQGRCWQSYCDASSDTCRAFSREGAACEEHEQCESAVCNTRGECEQTPWCADSMDPR